MYNTSSINISGILCSFGLLLVSVCCAYPCSSQKTSQLGCPRATRQVTRLQVHVLQETVKGPRRSKAQRVQHGTAWYSCLARSIRLPHFKVARMVTSCDIPERQLSYAHSYILVARYRH
jgi:hypothetical protein